MSHDGFLSCTVRETILLQMSFLVLMYLAGYTLPTELLQGDMVALHSQITELIQETLEPTPCTDAMPPGSTEAMPPGSTEAMPLCSTETMPPCSTEAMPPCSTEAMPPCSSETMPTCSTEGTQHLDIGCKKHESEQCQCPTPYMYPGGELELSQITVEDLDCHTEPIADNSDSQKEHILSETEGNVNRDYTSDSKCPAQPDHSMSYNPSTVVDIRSPELLFKAELVTFLTFTYNAGGVTSDDWLSSTTPPSSLHEKVSTPSSPESSPSDVDSTGALEDDHAHTPLIHIERSYASRLNHIELKSIEDTSSPTLASLCLRFFFLATGSSLHNVALSWKRLDDSMLQFIATHTPDLRTVSLVRVSWFTKLLNTGLWFLLWLMISVVYGEYCCCWLKLVMDSY